MKTPMERYTRDTLLLMGIAYTVGPILLIVFLKYKGLI